MRKALLCALVVLGSFGMGNHAIADHLTPERVVENTYTVILLMIPQEDDRMLLRAVFREVQSGKPISVPITYRVFLAAEETPNSVLEAKEGETNNGIIEFAYMFPQGGLYKVSLEFEKGDEPGKVYRPDSWTIWVPGQTNNLLQRYPIGFTEVAGFLALFTFLGVLAFSVWFKRKKGRPLNIASFGVFGSEESVNRRIETLRQERRKHSSGL